MAATKNTYVQAGDYVTMEASSVGGATLGWPLKLNNFIGILVHKEGNKGVFATRGVFRLPKATGSGNNLTFGATVYWDHGSNSNLRNRLQKTGGATRTRLGVVLQAYQAADTHADVLYDFRLGVVA